MIRKPEYPQIDCCPLNVSVKDQYLWVHRLYITKWRCIKCILHVALYSSAE